MHRFRSILAAVELRNVGRSADSPLSEPSREALDRAIWLAARNSAELTIFSAIGGLEHARGLLGERFDDAARNLEGDAGRALDGMVDQAQQMGVSAVRKLMFGKPWVEIIRQMLCGPHDLVVAGTRDLGIAGRVLLGSTGLKLLHHCPCPVWIAKPPRVISTTDKDPDDEQPLNVLVASDLSDVSLDAIQMAVNFGQLIDTRTRVLHSVEHDLGSRFWRAYIPQNELEAYRRKLLNDAERELHDQLAQTDYRTLKYGVQLQIAEGPADAAILAAVEEHAIDLLVMGTVSRSGVARVVVGNTAERLLPHLPCSVLALKPADFKSDVRLEGESSA